LRGDRPIDVDGVARDRVVRRFIAVEQLALVVVVVVVVVVAAISK
jgi:hypothetical protein